MMNIWYFMFVRLNWAFKFDLDKPSLHAAYSFLAIFIYIVSIMLLSLPSTVPDCMQMHSKFNLIITDFVPLLLNNKEMYTSLTWTDSLTTLLRGAVKKE